MKSNSAAWFVSGALAVALLTTNLASASPETTTITGCLTSKGSLTKVSAGATPLKPCAKGETQVTWASGGPNVAITTATLGAPVSAASALASGDNVVITPTTVTWTIDDSTDAGPCYWNPDDTCFSISIPYDVGTLSTSATAQAVLVEGLVDIPSAEAMEALGATQCGWSINVAPESAVTESWLWSGDQTSALTEGDNARGMGPQEDVAFHRMVFLGADPASRLDVDLVCYDGYGGDDPANVGDLPEGVAEFSSPFVITDLSVKVITFAAAV